MFYNWNAVPNRMPPSFQQRRAMYVTNWQ